MAFLQDPGQQSYAMPVALHAVEVVVKVSSVVVDEMVVTYVKVPKSFAVVGCSVTTTVEE